MENWNEDEDVDWGEGEGKEEQLTGMFIYMCVFIFEHRYVLTYMHICIYSCGDIYHYLYVHIYTTVYIYLCVYVCVHICGLGGRGGQGRTTNSCVYVCVHLFIYINI
jgi:hypothetical protein